MLKTQGLSQDTLAQCEPLIDVIPTTAIRLEFTAYLAHQLATATTLGLDHIGLPISSDSIESLFGVAKHHGVGETQDAARIALRLPAFLRGSDAGGSRASPRSQCRKATRVHGWIHLPNETAARRALPSRAP